jgi:hypothetical protein
MELDPDQSPLQQKSDFVRKRRGPVNVAFRVTASGLPAAAPQSSIMDARLFTGRCLPCFRQDDSTTQLRREIAALREFAPAWGRYGSFAEFPVRSLPTYTAPFIDVVEPFERVFVR